MAAVLLIILVIALVIVAGVFSAKAATKRREALVALADRLGFTFDPSPRGVHSGCDQFSTFRIGDNRTTYNTVSGERRAWDGKPVAVAIGDYSYVTETGSGKDRRRTTHRLSYCHARLPIATPVTLAVRRENFFDKIAGAVGFEDIDFESAEFSKTFHVKSSDKKFAYDLLDPRMIEWYLASDAPTLEIIGDDLLLTGGGVWTPEAMQARIDWLSAFLERWPAHVLNRLSPPPIPAI